MSSQAELTVSSAAFEGTDRCKAPVFGRRKRCMSALACIASEPPEVQLALCMGMQMHAHSAPRGHHLGHLNEDTDVKHLVVVVLRQQGVCLAGRCFEGDGGRCSLAELAFW